jgi:hypothetical protein
MSLYRPERDGVPITYLGVGSRPTKVPMFVVLGACLVILCLIPLVYVDFQDHYGSHYRTKELPIQWCYGNINPRPT